MNEQDNASLVRQLYAAFARQDIPALIDVLAEEIDWLFYGPHEIPFAGHYRGRQEVADFFARALSTSIFLEFTPREFIAVNNTVLVQGFERVQARTTERIWETEWAHVFTINHGKIVRLREYYDTSVIVEAFRAP